MAETVETNDLREMDLFPKGLLLAYNIFNETLEVPKNKILISGHEGYALVTPQINSLLQCIREKDIMS